VDLYYQVWLYPCRYKTCGWQVTLCDPIKHGPRLSAARWSFMYHSAIQSFLHTVHGAHMQTTINEVCATLKTLLATFFSSLTACHHIIQSPLKTLNILLHTSIIINVSMHFAPLTSTIWGYSLITEAYFYHFPLPSPVTQCRTLQKPTPNNCVTHLLTPPNI